MQLFVAEHAVQLGDQHGHRSCGSLEVLSLFVGGQTIKFLVRQDAEVFGFLRLGHR